MKRKIIRFIPLAILPLLVLTSCNLEANPDGPSLMTAVNYGKDTRMVYTQDDEYWTPGTSTNPSYKLSKGDYKPVWKYIQNRLGITLLEHQAAANSGEQKSVAYFRDNWLNKQYADISMGTVDAITKYSVQGNSETILDLKPYMFTTDPDTHELKVKDDTPLPNLANFLKSNPGVLMSIMTAKHSHPEQGAIYYVPYFDGFNDVEKLQMVRADFITKLLDSETSTLDDTKVVINSYDSKTAGYKRRYESYLGDGAYDVQVPNVNRKTGEILDDTPQKSYTKKAPAKGNIIKQQNDLIDGIGEYVGVKATSRNLVTQFKQYFVDRYGTPSESHDLFTNYSDLFLGYDACYDTDELIALMRIVKSSPESLFPGKDKEMVVWFPTECTNQRSADLYRWGGQVFGVRGPESRTGYLYLNGQKTYEVEPYSVDRVHDCRGDQQMVDLIKKLNQLYQEGLILKEFDRQTATGTTDGKFARELIINDGEKSNNLVGFMEYCYFQSEGNLNNDKECSEEFKKKVNYRPIVGAVTHWDTDGDGKLDNKDPYMQFTESWATVKTSALCLRAGLVNTPQKLASAFKFVDFIYSPEGKYVYNYGPVTDGYVEPGFFNSDGSPKTEEELEHVDPSQYEVYQGKKIPKFTEKALAQNNQFDNYLRRYVGATIPMGYEKLSGMSYQLTAKQTQKGIDIVNKAIECKTFRHVCTSEVTSEYKEIEKSRQTFYKIVPSSFYLTKGQNTAIANLLDKNKLGSIFTDDSKERFNIWDYYVMGTKATYAPDFENYLATVNGTGSDGWKLPKLVTYYQDAYELMV